MYPHERVIRGIHKDLYVSKSERVNIDGCAEPDTARIKDIVS